MGLLFIFLCFQIDAGPTIEERYLHLSVVRNHFGDVHRFIDGDVEQNFPIARFLEMANHLQARPESERIRWLRAASRTGQLGEAAVYLARMLIEPKSGKRLRPIHSGLTDRAVYDNEVVLPNAPLEIFDGVPFCIGAFGGFSGTPEHPEEYIEYLLDHGKWREHRFERMTPDEISETAEKYFRALEAQGRRITPAFKSDIREQASLPLRRRKLP